MTTLEKIARAICYSAQTDGGAESSCIECGDGSNCTKFGPHIADARAAVAAMRIPTKEMLEAVWELDNAFQSESSIEDVWTPMIDAILHHSK